MHRERSVKSASVLRNCFLAFLFIFAGVARVFGTAPAGYCEYNILWEASEKSRI